MLSVFDEGPPAPCPRPFNMAAYVLAAANQDPQKEALLVLGQDDVETWTFSALEAAVRGTATGFLGLGLKPGDKVLMRLGNTVDFPIAYLGALTAGLVPIPTSSALTEPETAKIITETNPKAILRDPDVACPEDPAICGLDQLRAFRALPPADFHMGDPDRLGYIIYTSGTSGVPRSVLHAHRAIWARRMMFDGWYGLTAHDRLLHAGAFNWTYTLGTGLMDPWTVGATALIPAAGTGAQALPDLLTKHRATIFAAAPGVYRQLLKQNAPFESRALRHGLSAGEKLPPRIAKAWTALTGTQVFEAYGMSECSTFISSAPGLPTSADTLGRPQPGRRVALIGDAGPVPLGTEGTIAVHSDDPGLMLGYLNAPEETAAKWQGEWFLTGDQGVMSEDGQITYLGRNDDMMNAGGYRVSPIEVESVLTARADITAVAVTDVEIKTDARVIAAFYTGPAALDDHELHTYVSDKLARYKQPRLYVHLPELPMGANGKILRRALRAGFEASK
ncbi:class I adenylate-forming enzyme family protein [uncultured Roseobacter sp.]|uniref:class I adenylate-forming enzyme family protein n=1 Tax=uncultured Roseobacter sp. TaxID=114847 RepID=UPI00261FA794|nr:class I adenylate-forming enzyme family protein [uncultured Roseobacter sp.]